MRVPKIWHWFIEIHAKTIEDSKLTLALLSYDVIIWKSKYSRMLKCVYHPIIYYKVCPCALKKLYSRYTTWVFMHVRLIYCDHDRMEKKSFIYFFAQWHVCYKVIPYKMIEKKILLFLITKYCLGHRTFYTIIIKWTVPCTEQYINTPFFRFVFSSKDFTINHGHFIQNDAVFYIII